MEGATREVEGDMEEKSQFPRKPRDFRSKGGQQY